MATQIVKDALLLCGGMLIGFGLWAALPQPEPRVERIHVPHYQERIVPQPVERECPKPPRTLAVSCPPHRSLEALALACQEGRLTHDGRVGILVEDGK